MSSPEQMLNWVLRLTCSRTVLQLNLAAIQVFMWIYMVSFYAETSLEIRKQRQPYVLASLVILLLSSASAIIKGLHLYAVLFEATPGPENVEAAFGVVAAYQDQVLAAVGTLLWDLSIRIADAVLVYRCYIVWVDRPWVAAVPACLWLAGTAVNIRTYIPLSYHDAEVFTVDLSLTVGLNILVTGLISLRLLQAHKRLRKALPNADHKIYLGIVAILVESAAPLAVFGIGSIVALPLSDTDELALKAGFVFEILFNVTAILAPQLIIFRVATGASWSHRSETSAALSHGIQFAGPGHGDEESIDRIFDSSSGSNAEKPKASNAI
ncbi:hypothetical protein BKA70DRAFT_268781 [Coprinopsis sp. MPI-PUGE-AT-0042]|nr:hypothetical protein BKA70DRAFT_268781 [Coprinopsis sp. MPI-PUGE-AT-0042]